MIQHPIYSPGLARTHLGLPCNRPSRNNIEQEVLLLLADEYRPTCAISTTNPGSSLQVGITISAAPSPASHDSRPRARSSSFKEFKFTTSISIAPSRSLSLQLHQAQHHGD